MDKPSQKDKTFQIIMEQMIETGRAPHYTEIAKKLGVPPEAGKQAVHELFTPEFVGWLFPNTDYISSFPPFSNLPTQYRITIDDQQKWFAQWGFEALAVSWLFPHKTVQIDAPCLDCGGQISIQMKDGKISRRQPETLMAYTSTPLRHWFNDLPYSWSTMNLFRSEEHIRNWPGFKPDTEGGIVKLADVVTLFSGKLFTRRRDPDYASRMSEYLGEFVAALKEMGPFWQPPEG